ncbi:MAG: EAL domain-containing protein, partial [Actinomycetia bacterium]|nr:EAL domain-containing protein [Actinomycetes bacterium]
YRWFDVTVRDFRHEPEVAGLVVTARDVTEERTAKENLQRSEAWFRSLVQSSSDVIAVLDDLGIITYISPAVMDLLGFDPDSLTGCSVLEIIPGDELHRLDNLRTAMELGNVGSRDIELRLQAADGTDRVVDITLSDLRDEPSVNGLVLNVRDITDRKALEHDLRHQALHDELTGLGNRLQFREHLRSALNDPFERGTLAVVFVDVDDFKTVNDSLGHTAGDEVLMEVANRLRAGLRPTDRVSRLGGDEFAVLFTEIETDAELSRLADRLLQTLSWPVQVQGIDVQVLVSLGIAIDADRTHTAEDLLRSADVAMYQAKDNGKGRWALFEESMQTKARERFDLQNALSTALDNPDEMVPHFQPIVELATGRIQGVEALVRWFHPELGLVGPGAFIPLAEETGMIVAIGRHVLERSLAQLAAWHSEGHDIYVSVNISAVQLQTDGIVADILGLVDHFGVARHKVVLELTETSLVNDFRSVITRIESLREAGIQVAIDDFGTGYSSLRYANEFKVDILKIDRAFVVDLEFTEQSTVISTIIELARHMGAKTVAEGIELPMMPSRLLRLGCELGQGYLFARPVAADVITVALEAEREGQTLVGLGR